MNTNGTHTKKKLDISTMVYGKIPPQARDLETAVLGAILLESECLPVVLNLIFAEVFYVDAHQRIFNAITKLYDKNERVDTLTVSEQLKSTEELDIVGGMYFIAEITRQVVSSANIEFHCRIILEKYMARELITTCGETITEAYEDSTDIFELYDTTDDKILKTQEQVLKGMVKDMSFYGTKVYSEYESVKATGVLGIQTHIQPIDKIFSGLVAPDLIIIAARPSQGKTALALSITYDTSVLNTIPCAWFSLEMNGTQLTRRLVSIDSKIPHETIRQGKIHLDDEIKFFDSIKRIGSAPIFIEDKGVINIRTIRTRAHILKRKHKIQYIVVDYLQLMKGVDGEKGNRENVISEISRGLKLLANELEMPIIALSQLNREVEQRNDKMPQLSDLRESGAIEQDADEVIFLMRPEWYDFKEASIIAEKEYDVRGLAIGKGAKNRHGGCKNFAMFFDAPIMYFKTHYRDEQVQQSTNGYAGRNYVDTDKDESIPF